MSLSQFKKAANLDFECPNCKHKFKVNVFASNPTCPKCGLKVKINASDKRKFEKGLKELEKLEKQMKNFKI